MINQERLEQLAKSDSGKVLMDYLDQSILAMSNITKIQNYEELLGKQEAIKILRELFNFLERAREEKPEPKKPEYI